MQGHFDVFVQDATGLSDTDFLIAEREGRLRDLIDTLPVVQKAGGKNQVTQMLPICMMRKDFGHGFPNGSYPMEGSSGFPFFNITILSTTSEPDYADWYGAYVNAHSVADSVDTANTNGKRFVRDAVETIVGTDPNGRESVWHRNRWVYLPSHVVSSEIRSVGVYWSEQDARDNSSDRGLMARVRMKDSGGNPITLNKTAFQALTIQYTFTLVSL